MSGYLAKSWGGLVHSTIKEGRVELIAWKAKNLKKKLEGLVQPVTETQTRHIQATDPVVRNPGRHKQNQTESVPVLLERSEAVINWSGEKSNTARRLLREMAQTVVMDTAEWLSLAPAVIRAWLTDSRDKIE